jgi:hypothetical protein
MSALSAKIRKARELRVEAGGFVFTVLRPTPLEREEKIRGESAARGILSLVIGWENVTEGDLIPGGDPHPLPFDAEACAEWLSDRPDLFAGIADAVVKGFEAHVLKIEDALKN